MADIVQCDRSTSGAKLSERWERWDDNPEERRWACPDIRSRLTERHFSDTVQPQKLPIMVAPTYLACHRPPASTQFSALSFAFVSDRTCGFPA